MISTVLGLVCTLGISAAASGNVIYSNITTTDGSAFAAEEAGFDDLHVVGGGMLSQITFTMIWSGFGLPPVTDANVFIALDDGDGVPNFDGFDPTDPILLSIDLFDLSPSTELQFITVDVEHLNIVIPDNATLWAGVDFTGFNVGQGVFGPPDVGMTDEFVYATNFSPFFVGDDRGLGWQLTVLPAPGAIGLLLLPGLFGCRRQRTHR